MAAEVLVDVAGHVATVTMNRPERLNAVTPEMHAQLREAFTSLGGNSAVRVIVLTGAGRGFCAGADMARLQGLASGGERLGYAAKEAAVDPNARDELQQRYNFLAAVPQPVIACINGAAAGIGFILALFSDLRFAAQDAALTTGFARRGLIAEHGSAWGLARLVGPAHAADLLLSARKITGAEAERIGLVNRALPADELGAYVKSYAAELAGACSPRSLRIIKQQLWALPFQSMAEAFAEGDRLMHESLQTADFKEGVAHFVEKRPPLWPT